MEKAPKGMKDLKHIDGCFQFLHLQAGQTGP